MGFSLQYYWSGLPFPPPGDLPDPRIKLSSPALQADYYLLSHWKAPSIVIKVFNIIHIPFHNWGKKSKFSMNSGSFCVVSGEDRVHLLRKMTLEKWIQKEKVNVRHWLLHSCQCSGVSGGWKVIRVASIHLLERA